MDPTIKEILKARPAHEHVFIDHPDGWNDIVTRLHNDILKIDPNYTVTQTKEKFGGLRFYVKLEIEDQEKRLEIYNRIHQAGEESYQTCENCGLTGKLREDGWMHTLCDRCDALDQGLDILTWEDEGGLDPERL